MLFNWNSTFFSVSSIFHTIQWEFYICFIFCQFSMVFNGDYTRYSMETFAFLIFSSIFQVFQWKLLKYSFFVYFPCYSMMQWRSRTQSSRSPPVFYRTLSPLGPLPCLPSPTFTYTQSRATGVADHILPLGDWFSIPHFQTLWSKGGGEELRKRDTAEYKHLDENFPFKLFSFRLPLLRTCVSTRKNIDSSTVNWSTSRPTSSRKLLTINLQPTLVIMATIGQYIGHGQYKGHSHGKYTGHGYSRCLGQYTGHGHG